MQRGQFFFHFLPMTDWDIKFTLIHNLWMRLVISTFDLDIQKLYLMDVRFDKSFIFLFFIWQSQQQYKHPPKVVFVYVLL